jgi:hypothetical protein
LKSGTDNKTNKDRQYKVLDLLVCALNAHKIFTPPLTVKITKYSKVLPFFIQYDPRKTEV